MNHTLERMIPQRREKYHDLFRSYPRCDEIVICADATLRCATTGHRVDYQGRYVGEYRPHTKVSDPMPPLRPGI